MKSTTIVIILVMTLGACMVVSSISSAAGLFLFPGPSAGTPGLQPESLTYDSIPRATEGCVVLYDNNDGSGKNHTFCLDGQNEFLVRNLKNESFNDTASSIDVGPGVKATLYADADQRGSSYTPQTGFTNLKDVWKNDVLSSLWLRKA